MKIKEGHYYQAKDGNIFGPIRRDTNADVWKWRTGYSVATAWTEDGLYSENMKPSERDLVQEITISVVEEEYQPTGWFEAEEKNG